MSKIRKRGQDALPHLSRSQLVRIYHVLMIPPIMGEEMGPLWLAETPGAWGWGQHPPNTWPSRGGG